MPTHFRSLLGTWYGTRRRGGVDAATTEMERNGECGVRLHVVIGEGAAVFELLA